MAKEEQKTAAAEEKSPALQQVAAENEKLKREIEALRGVVRGLESQLKLTGMTDDIREEVQARMRFGLSQQDAIEVVRRQRAHEQELKEQAKNAPAPAA